MKINMSRDITNKVHWILDNILPPCFRDCKPLMGLLAFIIYGKYGKYYLNFKEEGKFLNMSEEEMKEYYVMIEPIITRPTDINNACMELLFDRVQQNRPTKILDISCGRGYLSYKLAESFTEASIVGCDINIPLEMRKQQWNNLEFVEGNIEHLPFADEEFDMVISTHTLEHVINAEQALSELRRVCKNKLIIIVPCQREYKYTMDFHVQFRPYTHSLQKFTGRTDSICKKISNDLFYEEVKR